MKLTKEQKTGLIVGVALAVVIGGLVIYKVVSTKNDDKKKDKEREKEFEVSKAPKETPVSPEKEVGSPFGILPNNSTMCERYVQFHDRAWNYVKCDGTWFTQRKGGTGWFSLEGNTVAVNKLEAYSGN